jgi:hypothetical protein
MVGEMGSRNTLVLPNTSTGKRLIPWIVLRQRLFCAKEAKCGIFLEDEIIMRTAVEMDSSTAARLRKLADAHRISVEELLAAHVPGLTGEEQSGTGSGEEKMLAFEEWVAGFPQDTPPLSDEAVSRASIYRDR